MDNLDPKVKALIICGYWQAWSDSDEGCGIPWLAWDKVCMNKKNCGEFRRIPQFNVALLAKQGRRLVSFYSTSPTGYKPNTFPPLTYGLRCLRCILAAR
jgi:hypothetical protein